jgi:hypothetical protein
MTDSAYSQDVLTRIYNVHWGGTFVVGTDLGRIYIGPGGDDAASFTRVDNDIFQRGTIVGMSVGIVSGKAVVVAIGNLGGDFKGPKSGCQIVASSDGKNWSIVFLDANVPVPDKPISFHFTFPIGIVWDGTTFHASSRYRENVFVGQAPSGDNIYRLEDEGEQMYSSADGLSWAKEVKHGGWQNIADIAEIASALNAYCVKPQNSNNIPDGLQGYNEGSGTMAKPTSLAKFMAANGAVYEPYPPDGQVTFIPGSPQTVDFGCFAVADGWIAVGEKIATRSAPDEPFATIFEFPDFDHATCVVGLDARL